MTTNKAIKAQLDDIEARQQKFILQYQIDMHGDAYLENGERGVIGNIRILKEYIIKYPSIRWYMAHKPKEFWSAAVVLFLGVSLASRLVGEWVLDLIKSWLGL